MAQDRRDPVPERTDEQQRLSAVADYITVRPAARADLDALCELAAFVCGVPTAAVNLIDDRSQHQVAAYGIDPGICTRDESMCAVTLDGGQDVAVEDAGADPRFAGNPWVDGRLGRVRLYAAAVLRSPAGHVVGTLCVFDERPGAIPERRRAALHMLAAQVIDVLELQLRTARLRATITELARSHEQLAAFAAQVSHDLKSPLTATVGFAELLAERPSVVEDELATRYAMRCVSSGRRMLEMVDQLLGFARLGGRVKSRRVALDEVMPAVLEDLGGPPPAADVAWTGSSVPADPTQLRALLQNLVGNAFAYRRPDAPVQVRVTARETPLGVELTVTDNGPGIPPERRGEALLPLTRLRDDVPGSGLGLASCTRIVGAHGGSLQLDEAPGGGLAVSALFPG